MHEYYLYLYIFKNMYLYTCGLADAEAEGEGMSHGECDNQWNTLLFSVWNRNYRSL